LLEEPWIVADVVQQDARVWVEILEITHRVEDRLRVFVDEKKEDIVEGSVHFSV
jgi:hypothetical protein